MKKLIICIVILLSIIVAIDTFAQLLFPKSTLAFLFSVIGSGIAGIIVGEAYMRWNK